jgi:ComF family protein
MRERGWEVLDGASALVPVPLHRWRRLSRGFNQAAELARHVGKPTVPALCRVRATATQTGLTAAERRLNVRRAFAPSRGVEKLEGACVVLIDDVCTTGATLDACARELKAAGVAEVRALTACRVVTERR